MKHRYQFEFLLLAHAGLGIAIALYPVLVAAWVLGTLVLYGLLPTLQHRNANGRAHLAAAYLAGFEMTVRASDAGLPWETTKYAVIMLLGVGLLSEPRLKKAPISIVIFVACLVPSIAVIDFELGFNRIRQDIAFNLAGPICLAVAVWYFFRRPISRAQMTRLIQFLLLGLTTTLGYLFIKTPDISEIEFTYGANFAASGFGPNQMASALGVGILLLMTALILKLPVFQFRPALWMLMGLLLYRGLLTFSRGGMMGPLLATSAGLMHYWSATGFFRGGNLQRLVAVGMVVAIAGFCFLYVNELTGNKLLERYMGKRENQELSWDKYTSGRITILQIDAEIFIEHPWLGIGPGMGAWNRGKFGFGKGGPVCAHTEYTRLLAEHGIFGIVALGILFGLPLQEFFRRRQYPEWNLLLITLTFSTFAFLAHSATRTALPMFMYGLAFCCLVPNPPSTPATFKASMAVRQRVRKGVLT